MDLDTDTDTGTKQAPGDPDGRITAELLTIGDEISRGEIVDTNSAWLGEQLTRLGLYVRYRQGCNDEASDMARALRLAASRADVVIVSGGLGPTSDDLTVEVAAAVAADADGRPRALTAEPAHEARLRARYAERGLTLSENALRQVRVPAGAEVLENRAGLAPGFTLPLGRAQLYFLPGFPRELRPMFEHAIAPRLRARVQGAFTTLRRVYRVLGLAESATDQRLRDLLRQPPFAIAAKDADPDAADADALRATLHYRAAFPEVLVTLVVTAPAAAAEPARAALAAIDAQIRERLGFAAYSIGEVNEPAPDLPTLLLRELTARKATLATAESCTGGLIGETLTALAGSSAFYQGGVIAYANQVKQDVLGVREATLIAHGAVSRACVEEMAQGARRILHATYGVAVSGVAGPGGGTADKPVGTVHYAVAGPEGVVTRHVLWPGDRDQVRRVALWAALSLLYKTLHPERLRDETLRI